MSGNKRSGMRADRKDWGALMNLGRVHRVSRSLQAEMWVVVLEVGRTGCAKALSELFGAFGEQQESRGGCSSGCVGWNGRSPDPGEGKDL